MKEKKYYWDLKDITTGKDPEKLLEEARKKTRSLIKKKRLLTKKIKPEEVYKLLKQKEEISELFDKIISYYSLKFSENTHDSKTLAKMTKYEQEINDLGTQLLFFDTWFAKQPSEFQKKIINSKEIKELKYYLQRIINNKKNILSEDVEKIISIKDLTGSGYIASLYDIFTSSFKFEIAGKKLTLEEATSLKYSKKPELREEAYKKILGKYSEESTLLSEMYKAIVLDWVNDSMKIRNYKSPISRRNKANDIPDEAVETLLRVVKKNNGLFKKYFKLKYEILKKQGQKFDYNRYHLYAPYSIKERKYSFEESKKIVLEIYKEFSEEFYKAAKKIFDANHVHSHPGTYKRGGAFCYSPAPDVIPYILLNHTNATRDLFTMMHEFGHGIHAILEGKQTYYNYGAPLPLAETASIFGELLLAKKLLEKTNNKEEKKHLLIRMLDDQYGAITRQAYFVIFEQYAHEKIKEGITKEELDRKYYSLLKEQFGNMKIPEEFSHEWNYVPHIHHTPFYCYAYAWGDLLVLSLYKMYLEEGERFKKKYIEFLSAGGSESPIKIMKRIGADPRKEEFWQKGFDIIREEIKELKSLL